jgi:hypothetical protein
MKMGDAQKLAAYDAFFTRPEVLGIRITTAVFDRATEIRAAYGV